MTRDGIKDGWVETTEAAWCRRCGLCFAIRLERLSDGHVATRCLGGCGRSAALLGRGKS